jgi:hypothetical protein
VAVQEAKLLLVGQPCHSPPQVERREGALAPDGRLVGKGGLLKVFLRPRIKGDPALPRLNPLHRCLLLVNQGAVTLQVLANLVGRIANGGNRLAQFVFADSE